METELINQEKKKKKLRCPKCNYDWDTTSVMINVTCPSCQYKVRSIHN